MSDTIQERLRRLGSLIDFPGAQLAFDAADEIDRLNKALASRTAGFEALNEVRNTHSLILAETKRIADEKIDRLRAELDEANDTVVKMVGREQDLRKRIEELQGVGTKSIVDLQRAEKRIEELEMELFRWKEGCKDDGVFIIIDSQISAAWGHRDDYAYGFTVPQAVEASLAELGIVACEKCGGTKVVDDVEPVHVCGGDEERCHRCCPEPQYIQRDCTCPHNGWVMEGSHHD